MPPDAKSPLAHFSPGQDPQPHDADVCVIDLAARYVAWESADLDLPPDGALEYIDPRRKIETGLPYHLSEDWLLQRSVESWAATADQRRRQRQAVPSIDARAVLYDRLAPFVVEQCLAARGNVQPDGAWLPPEGWALTALPKRAKPDKPPTAYDAEGEIHARWLMTPREDLQGRTPREVLLCRREHIDLDLQHRSHQWSMLRQCPPGIGADSAAYRFGGFGSHENFMYYDLVRHLIGECWDRIVQPSEDPARAGLFRPDLCSEKLVGELRQSQEEWLKAPCEDFMTRTTPADVIALERQRIPFGVSGKEAMVNCNCPVCQMMAEDMGPMFCHFDGCNNDDDFPFTSYATQEELDEEERRREEFNRQFNEEQKLREAGLLTDENPFGGGDRPDSIWKSSYSAPQTDNDGPSLRLFGIAGHLGELITDLQDSRGGEQFVEPLNRYFGNVRAALEDPEAALLEPAVERFCDELDEVAAVRGELLEKCLDLQCQVQRFAARISEAPADDDIPF